MKFKNIDGGNSFDFSKSSNEYAKYRDIYPKEFYDVLLDANLGTKGQRCLDLGTGTGVVPRYMYKFGGKWSGTDISENQIYFAKELANKNNMDIDFFVSSAESTNFPNESFDLITAVQCFTYFDKEKVLPEIIRMLKPNGHFVILFMAWLPYESDIAMGSENLVRKFNPSWSGGYYERENVEIPLWSKSLFKCIRHYGFDVNIEFTKKMWQGRMFACRGVGASTIDENKKEAFLKEHWDYLNNFDESITIPHYVTVIDLMRK